MPSVDVSDALPHGLSPYCQGRLGLRGKMVASAASPLKKVRSPSNQPTFHPLILGTLVT
jgi:hypothetical protein